MSTVIFFDGICNLCNQAVQFVIVRDKQRRFKFASLQSDYAQLKLAGFRFSKSQGDSIVLLENGKVYQRTDAVLRIAKKLPGLWPLLYGLIVVPRFIRDAVYRWIAKNRYQWLGKRENCWLPTPALKDRFLG